MADTATIATAPTGQKNRRSGRSEITPEQTTEVLAAADPAAAERELRREMTGSDSYGEPGSEGATDVSSQIAAARSGSQRGTLTHSDVAIAGFGPETEPRVFELDPTPVVARPSVPLPGTRPAVPGPTDEPVGRSVNMGEHDDRHHPRGNSAELSSEADELDAVIGSNHRREAMSYDWCRDIGTGHRHVFSRHYYDLNLLVDRFDNHGPNVQREVSDKVRNLRAFNEGCASFDQRIGYLAYVVGTTPSLEDAERARQREVVSTIVISKLETPMGRFPGDAVIDMSSQRLQDLTRAR